MSSSQFTREWPRHLCATELKRLRCRGTVRIMNTLLLGPLVSLLAGILILVIPRLLNYIVAIYLIIIGVLGLFAGSNIHLR
jgi:hypothetical protein